jgi:hypothetical protein
MVKDDTEIGKLRAACLACDAALAEAGTAIEPGMSGYAVWSRFADVAMSAGAEACLPPTGLGRILRAGDLVSIDGCMIGEGGFAAHLASTFPCGDADTSALEAADDLLGARIAACVPGTRFLDLCAPGTIIHGCGAAAELPVLAEFPVITPSGAPHGVITNGMVLSVGCVVPGTDGRPDIHVRDQILITGGAPLSLRAPAPAGCINLSVC